MSSKGIVLHFRGSEGGVSEPGMVLSFAEGFAPDINPGFMQKLCGAVTDSPNLSAGPQLGLKPQV